MTNVSSTKQSAPMISDYDGPPLLRTRSCRLEAFDAAEHSRGRSRAESSDQ